MDLASGCSQELSLWVFVDLSGLAADLWNEWTNGVTNMAIAELQRIWISCGQPPSTVENTPDKVGCEKLICCHTVIQCPVWSFKICAVLETSHSPLSWFASVAGSLEGLKTDAATSQVSLGNDHACVKLLLVWVSLDMGHVLLRTVNPICAMRESIRVRISVIAHLKDLKDFKVLENAKSFRKSGPRHARSCHVLSVVETVAEAKTPVRKPPPLVFAWHSFH